MDSVAWSTTRCRKRPRCQSLGRTKVSARKIGARPSSTRKPQRIAADRSSARSDSAPRGPQPKPISPFPKPLFEATDDPTSFQDALVYHVRRFNGSYWQLYRAVVRLNETFEQQALDEGISRDRGWFVFCVST